MEADSPIRHTKHIFRVAFLLLFVLVVLILGRGFFVPESWGEHGWYRGDAVTEHRAREVRHHGDQACGPCHQEVLEARAEGGHLTVHCEVCHAPLAEHVKDDEVIAEMPIAAALELCSRCHRQLNARPDGFPQVKPRQHVADNGGDFGSNVCVGCHDPHQPI
jgi:hypothetical protein